MSIGPGGFGPGGPGPATQDSSYLSDQGHHESLGEKIFMNSLLAALIVIFCSTIALFIWALASDVPGGIKFLAALPAVVLISLFVRGSH